MPIIILSDEDRDLVINILSREAVLSQKLDTQGFLDNEPWGRLAKLFEKAPSEHTIRIILRDRMVEHVERMPAGFYYEVQDLDNCSECGEVEPLCEYCKEVRNG